MPLILFSYADAGGLYQEASYGHEDLESCLDLLTHLVNKGYVLDKVYLIQPVKPMPLPVQAFDGQLIAPVLNQLQE